jgi:hypothetical protein
MVSITKSYDNTEKLGIMLPKSILERIDKECEDN